MQAFAALAKAALVPATEFAVGLVAQPDPGDLNGHGADMAVTNFADAQLMVFITAPVGHGGQASQSPDFAPVAEGTPGKELHYIQPGTIDANASQAQQLPDLLDVWLRAVAKRFPTLRFQTLDLLLD